jgi:RNA polymerase sigma-70 factor (ECF subfamily)
MQPRRAARLFDMPSNFGWDAAGRLAEAAAAGDREALAGLIRATQRDVWRFVASQAGTVDADDLTQETYLRAIGALPRFEGRSSIRTWLLVIARRVVVDHHRHRAARPRSAAVADWGIPAERALYDRTHRSPGFEEMTEIGLLLDALAPDRREAMVLTQVLGLSYAEAAEICDCPVGTIRSRVARAREDLLGWTEDTGRPGHTVTG